MNCPPGEIVALLIGMAIALCFRATFSARHSSGDYFIAFVFVVIALFMPGVWPK